MSHSAILKQPITISYRALDLPAERLSPLLESGLFAEWFQAITDNEERKALIEKAHNHHNNLKGPAKGASHCESGVMSAFVAGEQHQSDQTFLDFARDVCISLMSIRY